MVRRHVRSFAGILPLFAALAACGGTDRVSRRHVDPAPENDADVDPIATGTSTVEHPVESCSEGAREECEKELVTGGVVGCLKGERACIGGKWSDCMIVDELDAMLLDAGLASPDAGSEAGDPNENGGAAAVAGR